MLVWVCFRVGRSEPPLVDEFARSFALDPPGPAAASAAYFLDTCLPLDRASLKALANVLSAERELDLLALELLGLGMGCAKVLAPLASSSLAVGLSV